MVTTIADAEDAITTIPFNPVAPVNAGIIAVRVRRLEDNGTTEVPAIRMAVPPHTLCFRHKNQRRGEASLTGPASKRPRVEPMLEVTAYYDSEEYQDWVPFGVSYDGLAYPEQVPRPWRLLQPQTHCK